nr:SDR family oxidoreductase [Sciscionella sp. SE31]
MRVDATRESDIAALFERVGEFDHLVYTANGAPRPQPIAGVDIDQARRGLDVYLWGVVASVKHAVTRIRAGGTIALTSGMMAVRPTPGGALGAAGAAAIEGLVRGLAVELAPVRVNAVRPGTVRTPMYDAIPEAQREAMFAQLAEGTLTGRVSEPEQIAAAHLYLMGNPYVTGTVLAVDGGSVLK